MNIKDLPQGSYKVVTPPASSGSSGGKMNVKDLPQGSYKTVSGNTTQDNNSFPKQEPDHVKQGFFSKLGNLTKPLLDPTIGALKGAGSTVANIGNMGQSVLDQSVGRITDAAMGKGFVKPQGSATGAATINNALTPNGGEQKLGFGAEKVGEFFVPGGAETDAANLASKGIDALNLSEKASAGLNLASKAAITGTSNAGITALQGGSSNDVKNAGLLGAAFPVASAAAKGLGKVGGAVVEHLASTLSGVPRAAIQHAIENPEGVQKAIQMAANDGEGATQKIYQNAVSALDTLKAARRTAYQDGLAQIEKDVTYTKNGTMYVKRPLSAAEAKGMAGYVAGTPIGVPTKLSTGGIKNVFTTVLKDAGAEGGGKGGLDFTNVALDDSHISKLQNLQNRIYNWNDTTPLGINRLRQVVDSYKVGGINLGSSENKFNHIIGELKTNLSSYVGDRIPQIDKMNKEYTASSQVIDNIRNQLKIGSADPNTALRKLVNVFNPKSSLYRPIVQQLGDKAGKSLMSDIAGLTMSQWTPEGLGKYATSLVGGAEGMAAMLHPSAAMALLPTAALSSPRVVGKAATTIGKIANSPTAAKLGKAAVTATRGALTKKIVPINK